MPFTIKGSLQDSINSSISIQLGMIAKVMIRVVLKRVFSIKSYCLFYLFPKDIWAMSGAS